MKKTIKDFDLNNKKVIIRVDFNVPIKNNKITDDNRIKASLETINYAINNGAKVILMSHLGRIKTEEDKITKSLKVVAERLSELLNKQVIFVPVTRGEELDKAVNNLKSGDVLLIENTRFEDLNDKAESGLSDELSSYWASLGDIFINDAFGTIHRAHASNVGISKYLPNGIGFLVENELKNLETLKNNTIHPYTVILGGAKISDKIKLIDELAKQADYVLIGGGMAFTFLKSEGFNVGASIVDLDNLEFASEMLKKYENKIVLPVDVIVAKEISDEAETKTIDVSSFDIDDIGLDIGPKTIEIFKKYINESNVIFTNGTMGMSELNNFKNGTYEIASALNNKNTYVGGGDTAGQFINFGFKNYTHISTGGGATLEFLEGKDLPGLVAINEK